MAGRPLEDHGAGISLEALVLREVSIAPPGAADGNDVPLYMRDGVLYYKNADGDETKLDQSELTQNLALTAGVGITGGAGTVFKSSVSKAGDIITTRIFIDLTGLNSNILDDIIGVDGAGVAHLGQITTARNGTMLAGWMKCLATPTVGEPDIDLYSAVEATGVEDTDIEDLDETLLLAGGVDWTVALVAKPLTALPADGEYLYLAGGGGTTDATYTAGKFLIELLGYDA